LTRGEFAREGNGTVGGVPGDGGARPVAALFGDYGTLATDPLSIVFEGNLLEGFEQPCRTLVLERVGDVLSDIHTAIDGVSSAINGIHWPAITPDMIPAVARGSIIPPQILSVTEGLDDIKSLLERIDILVDFARAGG